jgi:putative transposase
MRKKDLLGGDDVREVFEAILPDQEILALVEECRFQKRHRKLDALQLVRAMVIAASTGYGGRQADVMRLYIDNGARRVVRGAFYAWFNERLEAVMESLAQRALEYARRQPLDLPPLLARHGRDWHIVDSSTAKLPDELVEEYPGTGDYAALKVHKRFSVGLGTTVDYHISPAREHDARHLTVDESWRGLGLLVDLGYASLDLIAACEEHDVRFVMRLKDGWKPRVDCLARGELTRLFLKGTDLDALIESETLILGGRAVDADVTLGSGSRKVQCRLVGAPTPDDKYRFYLTNLPPEVGPRQVADIYRVRWEIESDNKLDKSCSHLDEARAETGPAARALVHASIISSMMACLVVHRHRLKHRAPRGRPRERTRPPLHPQSVARAMGSAAMTIAAALTLRGDEADREWHRIAGCLEHLGKDPNWRRSPSILDQMRGWRVTPGRPRSVRLASPTTRAAK